MTLYTKSPPRYAELVRTSNILQIGSVECLNSEYEVFKMEQLFATVEQKEIQRKLLNKSIKSNQRHLKHADNSSSSLVPTNESIADNQYFEFTTNCINTDYTGQSVSTNKVSN